MEKQT